MKTFAWIIRHPVYAFYWYTTGEPYSAHLSARQERP